MRKKISLFLLTATTGLLSANPSMESVDIATLVKNAAAANKLDVAAIVAKEITANPSLACEIVKSAVDGSKADATAVGAIVESAILAAPEQMVSIPKCALTIAPDSSEEVSGVISKYVAADTTKKKSEVNILDTPQTSPDGTQVNEVGEAPGSGPQGAGPTGISSTVADKAGGGNGPGSANANTTVSSIPVKPVSDNQAPIVP